MAHWSTVGSTVGSLVARFLFRAKIAALDIASYANKFQQSRAIKLLRIGKTAGLPSVETLSLRTSTALIFGSLEDLKWLPQGAE